MEHRPWHDCYDDGVPTSLTYPAVPIFHFLEESAKSFPDNSSILFFNSIKDEEAILISVPLS